jgi:uncharacterized membrane protein HdeD (DUF308 family)
MAGGFISIAAGILAVAWPGITAAAIGVLIGLVGLGAGSPQIVLSLAARNFVRVGAVWLLTGLLTTLFGIFVLVNPGFGIPGRGGFVGGFLHRDRACC